MKNTKEYRIQSKYRIKYKMQNTEYRIQNIKYKMQYMKYNMTVLKRFH